MLMNTDKNNMNKEVDLSDNILSLDADKEVILCWRMQTDIW